VFDFTVLPSALVASIYILLMGRFPFVDKWECQSREGKEEESVIIGCALGRNYLVFLSELKSISLYLK